MPKLNYKELKGKFVKLFTDRYFMAAFLLFIIGTFLRFLRLAEFVTFLGDQGRDAIIIKRILTLEHFPAIGPTTSVAQVYLGPFYYYFIAPWLLLFRFDPIGLAVGVAFFSCAYILITYFVISEIFNKTTAFIATFLVTFSAVIVDSSRYSWNPNLLPLFTILTVYFLIKALKTQKLLYWALAGAFLSFSIQLHYLALLLIPPIVAVLALDLTEAKRKIKNIVEKTGTLFLSFLFFSSPLLIFDLRHGFLNSRNFLDFFKKPGGTGGRIENLFSTFADLNKFSFHVAFLPILSVVLLLFIVVVFLFTLKKRDNSRFFLIFYIFLLFGYSFYSGPKYPHYFGTIYPIYFALVGYFLSFLSTSKAGKLLTVSFLAIFLVFNVQSFYFIYGKGPVQIEEAKKIAKIIYNSVSSEKYVLTSLPQRYNDYTYRYFLELWGRRPIEKDNLEKVSQLLVVCEKKCWPIGDPAWDIAYFAPRKVAGVWRSGEITIYKLTR